MADLVSIEEARQTFGPRRAVEQILREASADPGLANDLEAATGNTIDELWQLPTPD